MNRNANAATRVYCVDLAKDKFQINVFSPTAERCQRRTLSRAKFDAFFADPNKGGSLIVMEACASSYYWARRLLRRGYRVKLVPPQFVAKQRLGNKTDGNDADAIFAVHQDPRVRPVPVKSLEQQDLSALHRIRELLLKQRTQCINQARGLLAERGCVAPRGTRGFTDLLRQVTRHPSEEVTASLTELIEVIADQLRSIEAQLERLDARMQQALMNSPVAQHIDSVFGVGVVTATAYAGEFGTQVDRFADARQFAANLGLTPSEHSSGQRRRLGGITKRGNGYLRALLVQCAQAVVINANKHDDALCVFARRMLERHKRRNVVVVAVANHLARIIYAVIKHNSEYLPNGRLQPA